MLSGIAKPVHHWCSPTQRLLYVRAISTAAPQSIAKCYNVLGLPNESDQETVRKAFIRLVKRFHPDSQSKEADAAKFKEIEEAYRTLQTEFVRKRFNAEEGEAKYGPYFKDKSVESTEQDIVHTAPQHRQYLSHHGYGMGTPFQREKQYEQHRASKAAERVTDYKISRITNNDSTSLQQQKEKSKVKDIRTGFGMERLVEDLIQESMSKGEFDNIGGKGKPLKSRTSHNPYVDFVTHKMNEVLIDNGFVPQWITLQKEIREHCDQVRKKLIKVRSTLGPLPLNSEDKIYWDLTLERLEHEQRYVNSRIDFYNLVVPILNKQMTHFNLTLVAEKVLKESHCKNATDVPIIEQDLTSPGPDSSKWWNSLISSLFRK